MRRCDFAQLRCSREKAAIKIHAESGTHSAVEQQNARNAGAWQHMTTLLQCFQHLSTVTMWDTCQWQSRHVETCWIYLNLLELEHHKDLAVSWYLEFAVWRLLLWVKSLESWKHLETVQRNCVTHVTHVTGHLDSSWGLRPLSRQFCGIWNLLKSIEILLKITNIHDTCMTLAWNLGLMTIQKRQTSRECLVIFTEGYEMLWDVSE